MQRWFDGGLLAGRPWNGRWGPLANSTHAKLHALRAGLDLLLSIAGRIGRDTKRDAVAQSVAMKARRIAFVRD